MLVLPVRPKRTKGVDWTAEDRFEALFGGLPGTQLHTGTGLAGTQPDTVVLTAFDVAWHTNVQHTLVENVQPMVAYLDECARMSTPPNVVIVSTAYVQPPAPHPQLGEFELVPMGLATDVEKLYSDLLDGTLDWESLHTDAAGCHVHTLTNSYIFAKTLMEHLILARYGDIMPITIVRPSNIGPSRDGRHGVEGTFGPQLFASILQTSNFRFLLEGGGIDVVPVCGVANTIVDAIQQPHHRRIVYATCGSAEAPSVQDFSSGVSAIHVRRLCIPSRLRVLCIVAQQLEALAAAAIHSPKLGAKIQKVYDNYNYWTSHTWNFPPSVPSSKSDMISTLRRKHRVNTLLSKI